jgi:hypothetical protein
MVALAQKWRVLVVSEEAGALQAIADTLTTPGDRVLTAPAGRACQLAERKESQIFHRARCPCERRFPPASC